MIRQGDDYKGEFVVNTDPTAINGPAQMTSKRNCGWREQPGYGRPARLQE